MGQPFGVGARLLVSADAPFSKGDGISLRYLFDAGRCTSNDVLKRSRNNPIVGISDSDYIASRRPFFGLNRWLAVCDVYLLWSHLIMYQTANRPMRCLSGFRCPPYRNSRNPYRKLASHARWLTLNKRLGQSDIALRPWLTWYAERDSHSSANPAPGLSDNTGLGLRP